MRRIVITNKELFIALVNDEVTRELIPLLEIISVEEQGGKDESLAAELDTHKLMFGQSFRSNGRSDTAEDVTASTSLATSRHADTIKIMTKEGGYNAGRAYYLQASSHATRLQIIGLLNKYISHLQRNAEVRSKFKQSQDSVKRVINSSAFQLASSLLIVAVTPTLPQLTRSPSSPARKQ
jgi:hypothetical protein